MIRTSTEIYLTQSAATVLACVIANSSITTEKISKKTKISIAHVYRALKFLRDNHFLNMMYQKPTFRGGNSTTIYSALYKTITTTIDEKGITLRYEGKVKL